MVRAHGPCVGRLVYRLQYLPCILPSFDILVRLSTAVGFLQHPLQPGYLLYLLLLFVFATSWSMPNQELLHRLHCVGCLCVSS